MSNNFNQNERLSPEEKKFLREKLSQRTMDTPYKPRSGYFVHGLVKSTLSIALLVAFPGISILYAAEKALPDQGILYDLKRGGEEFLVSFYTSPDDQVAFRETQIKRRVEEVTQLALKGPVKPAHANALSRDIASHVASAEASSSKDSSRESNEDLGEVKESVKQVLVVQQKVLAAVAETQPEGSKGSITTIKETAAALENEITQKEEKLVINTENTPEEAGLYSEIENLLVIAKIEVRKSLSSNDGIASSTDDLPEIESDPDRSIATGHLDITTSTDSELVSASSTRVVFGDTRELAGADHALERLQSRFDIIKNKEAEEDSLENILTDVQVFLTLLRSDISLVEGFSFYQKDEVDPSRLAETPTSTDSQALQDPEESTLVKEDSTTENLEDYPLLSDSLDLPEPEGAE